MQELFVCKLHHKKPVIVPLRTQQGDPHLLFLLRRKPDPYRSIWLHPRMNPRMVVAAWKMQRLWKKTIADLPASTTLALSALSSQWSKPKTLLHLLGPVRAPENMPVFFHRACQTG
jgi:hypothetical protein